MKFIISIFAIFISSTTFAACNFGNVYQDLECEEKSLKLNKKELNKVYQQLFKKLDVSAQSQLENSQKSWLSYRDAHCKLIAKLNEEAQGAGQALMVTACMADLTQQRIQQLKELP